jgi:hypothetical protein
MAAFRVNEFEGRSCTRCKRPIAIGERYVRKNNGYTRCTRPECGGDALGPPPTTHSYKEEAAKPSASATGRRRRTGGHGYTGGDGFANI